MPHLLDRQSLERLEVAFPAQFAATSRHRFRSSLDVQFAFAYFHFVLEGGPHLGLDLQRYWHRELDTDGDGVLSANEFRTLAAVALKKSPTEAELASLRQCLAVTPRSSAAPPAVSRTPGGDVVETRSVITVTPALTLRRVLNCSAALEGLRQHARKPAKGQEMGLDEVAFEMITDDHNKTLAQLDSVRWRKPKFICVNDDMQTAPPRTRALLRDFYDSLFPHPSQFELPADGPQNPFGYVAPLRRWAAQQALLRRAHVCAVLALFAVAVALLACSYADVDPCDAGHRCCLVCCCCCRRWGWSRMAAESASTGRRGHAEVCVAGEGSRPRAPDATAAHPHSASPTHLKRRSGLGGR
jgi:UDP-N-acetylglucosamine-lysosomal-enzyme